MKILLDQDQILCKWTERIVEWYNQDYGTKLTREDIKGWNISEYLGPQGRDFMRSCMRWPEFYTRLDPIEGAIEGVKSLIADGHDVRIVTAVPASAAIAYHGKQQWIRDHMPFFDLDHFVALKKKNELKGDLLFDDGAHNLSAAMAEKDRIVVAMDCPWNQGAEAHHRVKSWREFVILVKQLKAQRVVREEERQTRLDHGIFS